MVRADNFLSERAATARDGYQALATSVIGIAIKDARRGKLPALTWLHSKDANLKFWCEVIGVDSDDLSERAIALIESKKRLPRERQGERKGTRKERTLSAADSTLVF